MKVADIFLFLVGHGGAIRRVAGSWWSLLVAALLVLTAGVARNYDHLDLLRNPEWIYGPFVASLITSLLVFGVVYPFLGLRRVTSGRMGYLSFLCIYWMTSPCAWLYGIPVESFTDLVTATGWNIVFLAVVSVWRVVLVTRSLVVLTGAGTGTCLVAVLFPASAIMCVGSFFKGLSLVGIMGGVRLPPHTELLKNATNVVCALSFWTALVLFFALGLMIGSGSRQIAAQSLPWRREKMPKLGLLGAGLLVVASLLATSPLQIKVRRNHRLASLIKDGQYGEAIDYASRFERSDFTMIHYLPPDPHRIYAGSRRQYQGIFSHLDGEEPEWLREIWLDQYAEAIVASRFGADEDDVRAVKDLPELRERVEELGDEYFLERFHEELKRWSAPVNE